MSASKGLGMAKGLELNKKCSVVRILYITYEGLIGGLNFSVRTFNLS